MYQNLYDKIKAVSPIPITFYEGLPSEDTIKEFGENGKHKLIVLDDLMHAASESRDTALLFTQYCHHKCLSCIFIQQNLFFQGKQSRTIAMNTWYLILFENIRDKSQIAYLARQVYPGRSKILLDAYEDAVTPPYGYLVMDFSPNVAENFRLRTNVFPNEKHTVYAPKL